jgi:tripartite-type tricarboxylate transporter receptor subunit TctC
MSRCYLFPLVVLGAALVAATAGLAQNFPNRPVRLIVPFAAGGGNDIVARVIAAQVEQQIGQPFVIDNRGGANGIIGSQAVANAEPDGYTLLHVSSSFTINNAAYKKLPYDIFGDFAPVANVCIGAGYVAVVDPKLPIHTIAELIAYAKSKDIFYGSPGTGNPIQLATELFKVHAGINMAAVPFRGAGPGLAAVVGGSLQFMFAPAGAVASMVQGGQLRAIGFSGDAPARELPNVPPIKSTIPSYSFTGAWHGWFAPARTPADIVARINAEVRKGVKTQKVRKGLDRTGCEPTDQSPQEFAAFVRNDAGLMAEAVKAAKIEPQ